MNNNMNNNPNDSVSNNKDDDNQDDDNKNDNDKIDMVATTTDTISGEQIISWIESRRSIGNLSLPAPTKEELQRAVACAMSAPDHKKLKPWRFIVTQGDARLALGEAMVEAAIAQAKRDGDKLKNKTIEKTRNLPMRAPVVITVVTHLQQHYKVPEFEQMLSAGAAVQNLLLALQALGYGTVWRTGLLANEPIVKSYFNVGADDYICAFVYTGTNKSDMPPRKSANTDDVLSFDDSDI